MTVTFAVAYILIYEAAAVPSDGAVNYPVLNELRHQAVSGAFADILGAYRLKLSPLCGMLYPDSHAESRSALPAGEYYRFFNSPKLRITIKLLLLYPLIPKCQAEFENYYRILNFAVFSLTFIAKGIKYHIILTNFLEEITMKKRILSVVLALCIAMSAAFAVGVYADDANGVLRFNENGEFHYHAPDGYAGRLSHQREDA